MENRIITNSNSYLPNQLGSFLTLELFEEAASLLDFQLESKYKGLKTLNFYAIKKCARENFEIKSYFFNKIANNLFYGLTEEFYVESYQISKGIFGIRNYKFFSYPMLLTYYAIGLYILRLSENILQHITNSEDIHPYYGFGLNLENDSLVKNYNTVTYFKHYKEFKKKVKFYSNPKNGPKLIIKLDIQNFYEDIDIKILLDHLDFFAKPEKKKIFNYNQSTKQNILFFFNYIMKEQKGVPQSEQNILSSYISHVYLSTFDFRVENYFLNKGLRFKYIRYVDDTYIILDKYQGYEKNLNQSIQDLEGILYSELKLRFNASKIKIYSINTEIEFKLFLTALKNVSVQQLPAKEEDNINNEKSLIDKANELIEVLQEIKGLPNTWGEFGSEITTLFEYDEGQKEKIKYAFEPDILNLIKKSSYQQILENIFKDFNFSLVTINTKAFLLIICSNPKTQKLIIEYLENKKIYNLQDAQILENLFLMDEQIFQNKTLQNKIITYNSKVYFKVLEKVFFKTGDIIDSKIKLYNNTFTTFAFSSKVIEQMKHRVYSEYLGNYTMALNFMLNEFQQICLELDQGANSKKYNSQNVTLFLSKMKISLSDIIQIENLFNRRNNNIISHPGLSGISPWEVTETEYNTYKTSVNTILGRLVK